MLNLVPWGKWFQLRTPSHIPNRAFLLQCSFQEDRSPQEALTRQAEDWKNSQTKLSHTIRHQKQTLPPPSCTLVPDAYICVHVSICIYSLTFYPMSIILGHADNSHTRRVAHTLLCSKWSFRRCSQHPDTC